jgi:BolA family transcriptional regulator, general stress-responsive regulator
MNAAPGPVAKRISDKLATALSPQSLEVIDESHLHAGHAGSRPGGETHFRVKVVSASFVGKSLIERHRKVNEVLADELKPDGVHALAIEAHAPDE